MSFLSWVYFIDVFSYMLDIGKAEADPKE